MIAKVKTQEKGQNIKVRKSPKTEERERKEKNRGPDQEAQQPCSKDFREKRKKWR